MCLEKISEKKIATEDIVCYKRCRLVNEKRLPWSLTNLFMTKRTLLFTTPYYCVEVELGKTYTSKLKKDIIDGCYNPHGRESVAVINEGLHSFKHPESVDGSYTLIECIIPKGSTYYEGIGLGYLGYASDQLHYVKLFKS